MSKKLTILVGGMIAGVPCQGGWTWAMLQYLLGFKQLGHDVYFVESLKPATFGPLNAKYFRDVTSQFGLDKNSALVIEGTGRTVGLSYDELQRVGRRSDVFVNVSGSLDDPSLTDGIPTRVYLDLDPGFTQLWQVAQNVDLHLAGHTHFVTIGLAIGGRECGVPTCGVEWIPTVQPIVMEHWPEADRIRHNALTTVANWRSYGSIEHEGVFYGQKVHSLRQFLSLPRSSAEKFMLALSIHPDERADLEALSANGWQLVDPDAVASTPSAYQEFVQQSKAEFGIAKSGYVATQCGWFSDRSICYLASGRPVIAQETGFRRFLPVGDGLFSFETQDDVFAAIDCLSSDYLRHRRAAREIAHTVFGSDAVLSRLLQNVGATA